MDKYVISKLVRISSGISALYYKTKYSWESYSSLVNENQVEFTWNAQYENYVLKDPLLVFNTYIEAHCYLLTLKQDAFVTTAPEIL